MRIIHESWPCYSKCFEAQPNKVNEHIFGYAVGVDLTRRDLQKIASQSGKPWDLSKGFDNSAPISSIVKKENEELSKFIGKSSSELKIKLGKTDEDFKNEKGNLELIYNSKKYLIPCERRFEINSEDVVIGFVSNGCF